MNPVEETPLLLYILTILIFLPFTSLVACTMFSSFSKDLFVFLTFILFFLSAGGAITTCITKIIEIQLIKKYNKEDEKRKEQDSK